MPKLEYFLTSFKGTNKRGVKLALYSHVGNKTFPYWEQNIPTLGMKDKPQEDKWFTIGNSHVSQRRSCLIPLSLSLNLKPLQSPRVARWSQSC